MDDNSIFNDIMQGLHEIEEYQKGNIQLRADTVIFPDDDITVRYNQLREDDKKIVSVMIDKMLFANRKAI